MTKQIVKFKCVSVIPACVCKQGCTPVQALCMDWNLSHKIYMTLNVYFGWTVSTKKTLVKHRRLKKKHLKQNLKFKKVKWRNCLVICHQFLGLCILYKLWKRISFFVLFFFFFFEFPALIFFLNSSIIFLNFQY